MIQLMQSVNHSALLQMHWRPVASENWQASLKPSINVPSHSNKYCTICSKTGTTPHACPRRCSLADGLGEQENLLKPITENTLGRNLLNVTPWCVHMSDVTKTSTGWFWLHQTYAPNIRIYSNVSIQGCTEGITNPVFILYWMPKNENEQNKHPS